MGISDPAVLTAEVSSSVAAAGLLMVFVPFFLQRLRQYQECMKRSVVRLMRRAIWMLGVFVALPAAAATMGLLTLWGVRDFSAATAVLTLLTIWAVVLLVFVTVYMERAVWGR